MSYDYQAKKNKHQKVDFQQYLYGAGEPLDRLSHTSRSERDEELLEDSYFMKRRFRQIAHRLRSHY